VVLSGAYAVLEGSPAIVAAVDRYVVADTALDTNFITDEVRASGLAKIPWFDARALRAPERKLGLGSSAAILVASLAADLLSRHGDMGDAALAESVSRQALIAHGKVQPLGSGVDVIASCFGGVLEAQRQDGSLVHHPVSLPLALHIEIWVAPTACDTSSMLSQLRQFRRDHHQLYSDRLAAQAEASEQASAAAQLGDARRFIAALAAQRFALEALGRDAALNIVTREVSALAAMAAEESAAVLPAGAGGGDIAIFAGLCPPSARLRRLLTSHNHEPLSLNLGARGVHGVGLEC
jgi:phosphomevalonate kinase